MKNVHKYIMYVGISIMVLMILINIFFHEILTAVTHVLGLCITFIQFTIPFLPIFFSSLLMYSVGLLTFNLIRTYFYKSNLRISQILPSKLYNLSLKLNIEKRIVLFDDQRPRAFCLGVLQPKIYISTSIVRIMNTKELEAILLHEKYHLNKNHNLFLVVFSFINNLFIFFPFINDLYKKYIVKKEIEADMSALNSLRDRAILISSFKKLLIYDALQCPSLSYISSYLNDSSLEIRIKEIIGQHPTYSKLETKSIIISIFSFLILACTVFYPVKIIHAHNDTHQSVMCLEKNSS